LIDWFLMPTLAVFQLHHGVTKYTNGIDAINIVAKLWFIKWKDCIYIAEDVCSLKCNYKNLTSEWTIELQQKSHIRMNYESGQKSHITELWITTQISCHWIMNHNKNLTSEWIVNHNKNLTSEWIVKNKSDLLFFNTKLAIIQLYHGEWIDWSIGF
jgi:hypothetical protein